jgi:hypothetical protein
LSDTQTTCLDSITRLKNAPIPIKLPVETDGGSGTAAGHWDEQCLTAARRQLWVGRQAGPAKKKKPVSSEGRERR